METLSDCQFAARLRDLRIPAFAFRCSDLPAPAPAVGQGAGAGAGSASKSAAARSWASGAKSSQPLPQSQSQSQSHSPAVEVLRRWAEAHRPHMVICDEAPGGPSAGSATAATAAGNARAELAALLPCAMHAVDSEHLFPPRYFADHASAGSFAAFRSALAARMGMGVLYACILLTSVIDFCRWLPVRAPARIAGRFQRARCRQRREWQRKWQRRQRDQSAAAARVRGQARVFAVRAGAASGVGCRREGRRGPPGWCADPCSCCRSG